MSVLTALGFFAFGRHLPVTFVPTKSKFRASEIMPVGSRMTLERLVCNVTDYGRSPREELYVRINLNDRIFKIPGCRAGPGSACALQEFVEYVEQRRSVIGDFRDVCGLETDSMGHVEFLY